MKKYLEKVKTIFTTTLFVIACIVALSLIITKISTGDATVFGYKPIFVPTASMEPTIHKMRLIIAKPAKVEDIRIGDIVVYEPGIGPRGCKIVHRFIGYEDGLLLFKGDNNIKCDEPVPADTVRYIVSWYPGI